MKSKKAPHVVLLIVLSALLLAVLAAAAYQSLSRTISRFSLDFYFPYMRLLKNAEITVSNEALLTRSKQELASALAAMQMENASLSARAELADALKRENAMLRAKLSMNVPDNWKAVHAEIISRNPVSWNETFVLDRGATSGIREGNLVIGVEPKSDGRGLLTAVAGRIVNVSENTSVAATVYSSDCKLSCLISGSDSHGVIQGENIPEAVVVPLKYMPSKKQYAADQKVVTSGYTEYTPSGMLVGTICGIPGTDAAFRLDSSRIYAETYITPALDVEHLRFAAVLINEER